MCFVSSICENLFLVKCNNGILFKPARLQIEILELTNNIPVCDNQLFPILCVMTIGVKLMQDNGVPDPSFIRG